MIAECRLKYFLFAAFFLCLMWLACFGKKTPGDIEYKMVFLSQGDPSKEKFDLLLYDFRTNKSENLTAGIPNLEISASSSPQINHVRNSVCFISFNKRNLTELFMATKKLNLITNIDYEATDFVIAPDGQSALYSEIIDSKIQLINVDLTNGRKKNLSVNKHNNFEARFSPDGDKIVYVADSDGSKSIAVMNKDGSDQRLLTDSLGDDRYPYFSPDGNKIVFSSARNVLYDSDYDIYAIDISSRNIERIYDSNFYDTSPACSPDGRYVAFISNLRGRLLSDIYIVDQTLQKVWPVTQPLKYFNQSFVFSPDSKFLIFENMGPADSQIYSYQFENNQLSCLINGKGKELSPAF